MTQPWPTPLVSGLVTALAVASQEIPTSLYAATRRRITNSDYARLAKAKGIVEAKP